MKELVFKYNDKIIKKSDNSILCGIINVTPDSFSDGGKYFSLDEAVKRGISLVEDGAKMLDIGGESTRPGSAYVQEEEEIRRIAQVVKELRARTDAIISVDTWRATTARVAIENGADIINDITGLMGDSKLVEVVSKSKVGLVLMFNPVIARPDRISSKKFKSFVKADETPFSKEELNEFENLEIEELMIRYLEKSISLAKKYNIEENRIMLDPGIGFGLTKRENFRLIEKINLIEELGFLSFLGVSRKRFIANVLDDLRIESSLLSKAGIENLDMATAFITAMATLKGVDVIRIHELRYNYPAMEFATAMKYPERLEEVELKSYGEKNDFNKKI